MPRDLTHWTKWSDGEIIDQAAAASHFQSLLEDDVVREAISANVIAPFRQEIEQLRAKAFGMTREIERLSGLVHGMQQLDPDIKAALDAQK